MGWQNNPLSSSSIHPLNIVPQQSVRLIGYGKPFNGPSLNPTNKPKLEYAYIHGLLEGNYSCDKITPFSYLNSNTSSHCETQIANNHAVAY